MIDLRVIGCGQGLAGVTAPLRSALPLIRSGTVPVPVSHGVNLALLESAMPPRKIVTKAELSQILTDAIQQIEDMEGTTVTVPYSLVTVDPAACNWNDVHTTRGPNVSSEQVSHVVSRLVQHYQALYNVSD